MHTIFMRTTLNLREDLIDRARELTDIREKTALIHEALQALIEKCTRQRLIELGGSEPDLRIPGRR